MAEKKKKLTIKDLLEGKDVSKLVKDLSFEDGLELLEELVEQVEGGSLDLDRALASYEKGSLLLEKLRADLSGAEKKLETLSAAKK